LIKDWEHRDISLKELIDLGLQIPSYSFYSGQNYSIINFNELNLGLQAVAYGSNPPDLMIQKDVKSLIPEIEKRLDI
jgi:hypothetical protein